MIRMDRSGKERVLVRAGAKERGNRLAHLPPQKGVLDRDVLTGRGSNTLDYSSEKGWQLSKIAEYQGVSIKSSVMETLDRFRSFIRLGHFDISQRQRITGHCGNH